MKLLIVITLLSIYMHNVLALTSGTPTLTRRKLGKREKCNIDKVESLWKDGPDKPENAKAVVCYDGNYAVADKNAVHPAGDNTCKGKWAWEHTKHYQCFYLIGKNSFQALGDGGFVNLALQRDASYCDWDTGSLTLNCGWTGDD